MTYLEVHWKFKLVTITSIVANSGKIHLYLKKYVGRSGIVIGESKCGRLLIQFKSPNKSHNRAIPAGCVSDTRFMHIVKK